MTKLVLEHLATKFAHIPPESGRSLAQAAAVCLNHHGHRSGTVLKVHGEFDELIGLEWSFAVTPVLRHYWNDLVEATEYGAYAMAILLMHSLTGLQVAKRSGQGTGFDWWLGPEDNLL